MSVAIKMDTIQEEMKLLTEKINARKAKAAKADAIARAQARAERDDAARAERDDAARAEAKAKAKAEAKAKAKSDTKAHAQANKDELKLQNLAEKDLGAWYCLK